MGQLLGRFVYIPTSANRRHCRQRRRLHVYSRVQPGREEKKPHFSL